MLSSTARSQSAALFHCAPYLQPSLGTLVNCASPALPWDRLPCQRSAISPTAVPQAGHGRSAGSTPGTPAAAHSTLNESTSVSRGPLPAWLAAGCSPDQQQRLPLPHHRAYSVGHHDAMHIPGLSKAYRERRLMPFTQQQMYDVIVDVGSYDQFVPWCLKSTVTKELSPNKFEADLEVGFQLFNVKYTSIVTTEAPMVVHSVAADAAVFKHLSNHWEVAQGPTPGTTWLTFSVDFAFKSILYRQAASLFFDQVQKKMIEAFHKRCTERYKTPHH